MGQALYRQYRPKGLDEVVGQDHITTTLRNALKSGKISHAYLFTGPRGVGKTSIARILAHEVNEFTYDESATQLDIIEIDAASNRRIDEIRDLRDKVHLAPTSGKYKVYIIDEVHMLTKEAFNALLKTLEEPPEHVIFILATTEAHKLPETIVSRTQRFSFKPIDLTPLIDHLKSIAKKEKIDIDDDALTLIAEHGGGSFRDSISLLDQASSMGDKVTLAAVQQMLGLAPDRAIYQIIEHLSTGSPKEVIDNLTSLEEQGFQPSAIAKQIGENIRYKLIENQPVLDSETTIDLLGKLLTVPASPSPDKQLEVILLDIVFKRDPIKPKASGSSSTDNVIPTAAEESHSESKRDLTTPQNPAQDDNEVALEDKKQKQASASKEFRLEDWPQVLDDIKGHHNTLYGILRMATPSYDDNKLTLSFKFAFHQKRINEPRMHQNIVETFGRLAYAPVVIEAVIDNNTEEIVTVKEPVVDIAAISNIFGDAEVLES